MVDSTGAIIATMEASASGMTAELEILRGDLAKVLYDVTKDQTRYIFGDCIAAIKDEIEGGPDWVGRGGVEVTFQSGKVEKYDCVVVADGIGSRTRQMVFGDEIKFHPLGMRELFLCLFGIANE